MAKLWIYLTTVALCALFVYGQGDVTLPKTVTISVQPKVANSETPVSAALPPVTAESTVAADTDSITIYTAPETTSIPNANTTTSSSTTTTTTTTSSTSIAPPPAPTPTPVPGPPQQGTWSYEENNVTCIVVQFAAQFNVSYTVKGGNNVSSVLLNVPASAAVTNGSCGAVQQWLELSWPAAANASLSHRMLLLYQKNDTTKVYALGSLNVSLDAHDLPDAAAEGAVTLGHGAGAEWATPLATSYRCARVRLTLAAAAEAESGAAAALALAQLQEEAFRSAAGPGFSAARECGGGDVPDAVPIAVGCALAALVLVVLAAYLVGRRRSAARGYLSM